MFGIFYGELVQIFSLLEPIWSYARWRWMLTAQYADIMRKRSTIYSRNVRLWQMCGHCFEERFRNAMHKPQIFFLLVHTLVARLTKELKRWAITMWEMWNARNKFYFEDTQVHPEAILCEAMSFLEEYQKLVADQRTQ